MDPMALVMLIIGLSVVGSAVIGIIIWIVIAKCVGKGQQRLKRHADHWEEAIKHVVEARILTTRTGTNFMDNMNGFFFEPKTKFMVIFDDGHKETVECRDGSELFNSLMQFVK